MTTGQRAFVRRSKVETLEAIINGDPPPLPGDLPLPVKWCIDRCLAKDPPDRYNSTLDLVHDLRNMKERFPDGSGAYSGAVTARKPLPVPPKRSRRALGVFALGGLLAGILATAIWLAPSGPDGAALRFVPLATAPEFEDRPAWSPQGGIIAYQSTVDGKTQIFTRSLQSATAVQVTHCPVSCDWPEWSGDGRQIFLRSEGNILVIGAAGGNPRPVVQDAEAYTLSPDGKTLAFIRRNKDLSGISVWTSSPPGAEPRHYEPAPYEGADTGTGLRLAFSPDGKSLLIWGRFFGRGSEFWMLPYPAGSAKPRQVFESLSMAFPVRGFTWLPDGRTLVVAACLPPLLYRSQIYLADLRNNSVKLLVGGIGSESFPVVSRDGKQIAYTAMQYDADVVQIPLDGSAPRTLVGTGRLEHSPVWSPLGREFAYVTDRNGPDEIWIRNIETGRELPIVSPQSFPGGNIEFMTTPVYSADGDRLAFVRHNRSHSRDVTEIWIVPANGGAPVRLADTIGAQWTPTWSPDGNSIAFTSQGPPSGIMKARVGSNEPPEMLWPLNISVLESVVEWSPAGEWIAAASKDGVMLISTDGKTRRILRRPAFRSMTWSRDGAVIYGLDSEVPGRLVSINVATATERELNRVPPGLHLAPIWIPGMKLSLSPDGKSLATTSVRQSGDIWLLENFNAPPLWQRLFQLR
jgi:Tol biopolymer transport system component